ncbi:hypothetical protein H2198_006006 [Neophaeococcomyces mojaviensis]|uniref:Uncharacterized protein n=1 Tax=Neophaeococcomyces mojaviensis TaxID=3383035 RepID=A0ACC3A431_9EURO|nr:hypothetical protein H2198_006006 [Knufia sp. JES_112]
MVAFGFDTEGKEVVEAFIDQVHGRTFLITGPTPSSIGAYTALALAQGQPSTLILLGRSSTTIQPLIDQIAHTSPNTRTLFFPLDLSSLTSVRSAAATILSHPSIPCIDVVINNAGIMAAPYTRTEDGFESQFALNHLGHFFLTNLLMPKVLAGEGMRVVNVSSYQNVFCDVLPDPGFEEGRTYNAFKATGRRAEILRRESRQAALDPNLSTKDSIFLDDCQPTTDPKLVASYALSQSNAARCWNLSEEMVHQKFNLAIYGLVQEYLTPESESDWF